MIRCTHLGRTVLGVVLIVLAIAPAATADRSVTLRDVPNVYGGGVLVAFSALDGDAAWAIPFVSSASARGPGLDLHVPGAPRIRVLLPGRARDALRYRVVTGDLIVADVEGADRAIVIGCATPNLIVGRVPKGVRVAVEGKMSHTAMLRKSAGRGTQFAFGYDPSGAARAAEIAAAGLATSIESLVESRLGFFETLPPVPGDPSPGLVRAFAKACSVMKVNIYAPEKPIKGRWTTPSRWPHRDMWLWDSAFHSLGLMHLDVKLAKEALRAVYGFQSNEGFIPHQMSPSGSSSITQPPVLAWAAWQVYAKEKMRDREFLRQAYEAGAGHVEWIMKNRRLGGAPPSNRPLEYATPLYAWASGDESGADNSPRFDGGTEGLAAIDLSCYLIVECKTLQRMAQVLGYRVLAATWERRAEALSAAVRAELWDADRGFFFDRRGPGGKWVHVWSHAGFLPLWAGLATPEQAAALLQHLKNREKFWTALPVPGVAKDDPTFAKDMWRGPTWVHINYLITRGLFRYGFRAEAEELRGRTVRALTKTYEQTGCLWEFYDPDLETPPGELDRKSRLATGAGLAPVADYGWTAALFVDLVMRPELD